MGSLGYQVECSAGHQNIVVSQHSDQITVKRKFRTNATIHDRHYDNCQVVATAHTQEQGACRTLATSVSNPPTRIIPKQKLLGRDQTPVR